jgi:GT2 family glycosyltransferase
MFTKRTTLIIPTRNRINLLKNILTQLKNLKVIFNEIIVVDSSDKNERVNLVNICSQFRAKLLFTKASSSLQRNVGLKYKKHKNKFVMFLDDDVIFYKNTFLEMNKIVKKYQQNANIVGFCFNQVSNEYPNLLDRIKSSDVVKKLNLYSNSPGQITKSGWHTKILNVKKDTISDWAFTTASIYKSKNIKNKYFNTSFGAYSYLEDLDFSLNVTQKIKKIIISSKARFKHPMNIDRSSFLFGKVEVINRYKIVRKYNLSKFYFFINAFIRFFISFIKIFIFNINSFLRSFGNFYAIILIFFIKKFK